MSQAPKIGLCAFRKSGNYLLIRILKSALQQLGAWQSYSIFAKLWDDKYTHEDLSYPEEAEIDEMYVEGDTLVLYKGPCLVSEKINKWDLKTLNERSQFILTHQKPMQVHHDLFGADRKWIYIIRDGRGTINSWMHYAVSPVLLRRHPDEYKISDVRELYALPGYVEKHTQRWREHVDAYLELKDKYYFVRFEDLTKNKAHEVRKLFEFLGIADAVDINIIVEETGFDAMQKKAPGHVRKGKSSDWREYFSAAQKKSYFEITNGILEHFGYGE